MKEEWKGNGEEKRRMGWKDRKQSTKVEGQTTSSIWVCATTSLLYLLEGSQHVGCS